MGIDVYMAEYQTLIGKNIKRCLERKNMTQREAVLKCEEAGHHISQATISNAINGKGNLTFANLLAISYVLEVNIADLVDVEKENNEINDEMETFLQAAESELFITDPESRFFKNYLREYNILFYKTTGTEKELITGKALFSKSEDKKRCRAHLIIYTEDAKSNRGQKDKDYIGELILSNSMHAAYCYLVNHEAGEMCMLVFHQWYSIQLPVASIMAAAITTASGSKRLPTVHRMCLIRKEADPEALEAIKGQLLMNTSEIILRKRDLVEILKDDGIPKSFRELLERKTKSEPYLCVCETDLDDSNIKEEERAKWISYIRARSEAPRYNKISQQTEERLYSIVKGIPEK